MIEPQSRFTAADSPTAPTTIGYPTYPFRARISAAIAQTMTTVSQDAR